MNAVIYARHHGQRTSEMLSPKWPPHSRLSQPQRTFSFVPCLEGPSVSGNKISALLVHPLSCQQSVCLVLGWQIIKQSPQSRPLPQGHPIDKEPELWSKAVRLSPTQAFLS